MKRMAQREKSRSEIACPEYRSGLVLRLSTFKPNSFADFCLRRAGVSEELLIVNSLRTASFVSRERFFLQIMGSDSISCPKPFLGEIINFRAEQPNRKFSICVMTASSARKLGIIWNPLPDSGSGLVLGLSNSKRNGLWISYPDQRDGERITLC